MGVPDQLRVRLLGGLEIEGLDERAIGSRKARTLVKLLALGRGAPVGADVIIDALWQDDPPAKPQEQVGVLVSRLRHVVGADRLTRSDAGWALAIDWLDVVELGERVEEAAARLAAGSPGAARAAARAALTLVRGELVADEADAPWAEVDRSRVARDVARARLVAAEAALASGDPIDASVVAEGALDHDPYDEAALRVLMRAHASASRPASALAAYARVRERLAEDLGVDPVKETEDLHTSILLGDMSPATPAPAPRSIVGRVAELGQLDDHLSAVVGGGARAVVVEGEAGIGKTALVNAWTRDATQRAVVLVGRCDELGRSLPLQPVLDGLAAHLRRIGAEEAELVLGDAADQLRPMLGPAAAGPAPSAATTVADSAAAQAVLFADLLAAIERTGAGRPVVVVVEDMHLAAVSTVEWLQFAARRGDHLLLLATRRPDEGPSLTSAGVVTLGALDMSDVTEMVGEARAAELFARSGGHPLFLVELAAANDAELPGSVRDAVASRIARLGDAATTLHSAAVLGNEVDIDLLAGVLGAPVAVLIEHIELGLRARIIEERSSTLAFRHELVRESLVADTTATRRAFVHREAARVLRDRPRHDPLQVAWHAQRGGDVDTAIDALVRAGALAVERHDSALAEKLLTEALALGDNIDALLARARVRIARWDIAGAQADTTRALELGSGAQALEVAAWVEYYRRDYESAFRYAEEAVARSTDESLRASCLAMCGRVLHARGELHEAEARLVEAVEIAPPRERGLGLVWLGCVRSHQGRATEATDLIDRGLTERIRLPHPFATQHGFMFRTLSLGQRGLVAAAFRSCEDTRADAVAIGESGVRFVHVVDNVRSWLLRNVGRIDEADELSTSVLETTTADGSASTAEMRHAAMLDLVDGRLAAGDLDGAGAAIEQARPVEVMHGTMAWHHRQRYLVQQARFLLARGELDRALDAAERAVTDARERGSPRYELFGRAVAARVATASDGRIDRDALDAVLAELDRCGGLEAWFVTAELAAATGDDRWWRDAERRAGALIANAGDEAEGLRRWVATKFATLGRF